MTVDTKQAPPSPVIDSAAMPDVHDEATAEQTKQAEQTTQDEAKEQTQETDKKEQEAVDKQQQKEAGKSHSRSRGRGTDSQDRTQYQQDRGERSQAQIPQKLGHKINVNSEVARQTEQSGEKGPEGQRQGPEGKQQAQKDSFTHERPMPQRPSAKDLRSVLQERCFRQGGLKDSPLHQNLKQQLRQHQTMQQSGARFEERPMEKSQLVQFARLRSQAENKEEFRRCIKHELALAKKAKMSRQVQSIRQQTDSKQQKQQSSTLQRSRMSAAELSRQQFAQKLQKSATQSQFEKVLQQTLAGNKKAVPNLPQDVKARYAVKSDAEWNAFFKNVANLNSAEVKTQGKLANMMDALFRGLYNKTGTGQQMLVADFNMAEGAELAQNKFSQVIMNDEQLMNLLKKLAPGDVIPKEFLQKMGNEFEFIKLASLIQLATMSEEQKNQILKMYRQQYSPDSQKRLEKSLVDSREESKGEGNKEPFVYAGHIFDNKEERGKGATKFYIYMFYGVVAFTIGMILFILFRHLF